MSYFQKISVVIPAYNSVATIIESLDSVRAQNYPAELIELIVVDDGSTDTTVECVTEWSEKQNRPVVVISIPNSGPGAARNVGWQAASAPWIQFLDADDLLHPAKFSEQVSQFLLNDRGIGVYYSPWAELLPGENSWRVSADYRNPWVDEDPESKLLLGCNFIQLGAQLISKEALESVGGFDPRYRVIEDVHLNLRIALAGWKYHCIKTSEPVLFFRLPQPEVEKYERSLFLESIVRNASMMEERWRAEGTLTDERIQILCDVYQPVARYYSAFDSTSFNRLVDMILRLRPKYIARASVPLRLFSHLFGYRWAERIGALSRKIRRLP